MVMHQVTYGRTDNLRTMMAALAVKENHSRGTFFSDLRYMLGSRMSTDSRPEAINKESGCHLTSL